MNWAVLLCAFLGSFVGTFLALLLFAGLVERMFREEGHVDDDPYLVGRQ